MIQVKICGVTDGAAIEAARAGGATHLGFVFFPPSPRDLAPDRAAGLAAQTGNLKRVGVFVDADDALIDEAVAAARLNAIQLHGAETHDRATELKRRHRLEIWRAIPVKTAADVRAAQAWRGAADLVLFDAKPPTGASLPGGNGVRLDWSLLAGVDPGVRWGLSGGLDAATVAEAVRACRPPLVDVSSGVEDAPGRKSPAKIKAFLEAARA